jgi:hypothetical protein
LLMQHHNPGRITKVSQRQFCIVKINFHVE